MLHFGKEGIQEMCGRYDYEERRYIDDDLCDKNGWVPEYYKHGSCDVVALKYILRSLYIKLIIPVRSDDDIRSQGISVVVIIPSYLNEVCVAEEMVTFVSNSL